MTGSAAIDPLAGIPVLEDLPPVADRRVLVRVDFNVPLVHHGGPGTPPEVLDDFRIRAALPTLEWLIARGAAVTACTHLGRPKGKVDPEFDLAPVRERLQKLAPSVALLDNLRFDPGEEAGSEDFTKKLVDDFDAYVNDAFGASHREHASITGPPKLLPSAAGRLLAREVEVLGSLLTAPERPFVAVVGGAKVADKLGVLRSLLEKVDLLVVGGGMAYTFLAAQGHTVGASLLDPARVEDCSALIKEAAGRLLLPRDFVCMGPGGKIGDGDTGRGETAVASPDIPDLWEGVDIGPVTREKFAQALAGARTVLWNGPVGAFEDDRFDAGTRVIAESLAGGSAFTVVGGGDTVAALDKFGLATEIGFVSTGGGASLEFIEYGDLPGLRALRSAPNAPDASRAQAAR